MILNLMYLVMGVIVGVILRYETDIRARKKKAQQRVIYIKSTASEPQMKRYDDILNSIKSINESLASMNSNKPNKKEVR